MSFCSQVKSQASKVKLLAKASAYYAFTNGRINHVSLIYDQQGKVNVHKQYEIWVKVRSMRLGVTGLEMSYVRNRKQQRSLVL